MKNIYFIVFILMMVLNACGLYRQNVVNVPLFQEKGKLQVGGHASFTGYDAQMAYAFSKKFAVLGNYSVCSNSMNFSSTNFSKLNHQFYEFGFGHFRKTSKDLIHEYFIVVGQGSTNLQTSSTNSLGSLLDVRSANYSRVTFQADFGKIKNKFEFAVTPRLFYINYYSNVDTQGDAYKTIPHAFLWSDLAFSFRYSPIKFLKIASQVSCTLPIIGIKNGYYEASPFNASLGVVFNLR